MQIVNILPVFFNMKVKNYFLATLIGSAIPKIIYLNLINSFFKSIENNDLNSLKIISNMEREILISYEKTKLNIDQIINFINTKNIKNNLLKVS